MNKYTFFDPRYPKSFQNWAQIEKDRSLDPKISFLVVVVQGQAEEATGNGELVGLSEAKARGSQHRSKA